jgi:hypothetical protein
VAWEESLAVVEEYVTELPVQSVTVVQAVRWRLIKSRVGFDRRLVLSDILDYDILNCSASDNGPCVISALAHQKDTAVTEELVRLLSVMASDSLGRAYLLLPHSTAVNVLYTLLTETPGAKLRRKEGVATLTWGSIVVTKC